MHIAISCQFWGRKLDGEVKNLPIIAGKANAEESRNEKAKGSEIEVFGWARPLVTPEKNRISARFQKEKKA